MIIVINATHFLPSAGCNFLDQYFLQTAATMPQHQFIFITAVAIEPQLIAAKNITNVVSYPKAGNPLMWKIWLDYQLPSIARKHKAELLINTGGVCSLRLPIPQWLFISDLSFLSFPTFFSKKQLYYLRKNTPAFLKKANHIAASSVFLKKEIIQHYPFVDTISTFQIPINKQYRPLGWSEKELVKEKYAQGKEYFLSSGEIHSRNNLLNLLKAFSFFKKRQKSNMQLIITGNLVSKKDPFIEMFKTYKYRAEVSLLAELPDKELAEITGAAYAFLHLSAYDGMAIFPLQAMQCEVPVIDTTTGAIRDMAGEAALYADPSDFENIAQKMMLVFKDESLRAGLVNRGRLIIEATAKDAMEDIFWKGIEKQTG